MLCCGNAGYTCYPSMATIGKAIGRNRKTVEKYVDELVEVGLILTEPTSVTTKDGMKWNGNLKYTLLDPQRAVDLFNERQLAKLDAGVQKKRKVMDAAEKKRERRQIPHAEYIAAKSKHEPEELPL
ncbi:MAG: helix-turn-helix domain-containing protein [Oscillospiraceae bacterium]|nr:helix-turn-helix domain-containing protein [Oscillospiraceae bacterium]